MFTARTKNRSAIQEEGRNRNKNLKLSERNTFMESFNFKIGTILPDETDPTLAWAYNIPILLTNQKGLMLKTETFQITLFGFIGYDFPNRIMIACDSIVGYSDFNGQPTNKFLVLELVSINSRAQQGIDARDLIYRNQNENSWELGSLRDLKFRIYIDDQPNPVKLPTINDFSISFKILHIAV